MDTKRSPLKLIFNLLNYIENVMDGYNIEFLSMLSLPNVSNRPPETITNFKSNLVQTIMKPAITIEYCPKCHWLLRAAYMAQEILTTFADDVQSVTLEPCSTSGQFTISINGTRIFDRKEHGGFPEIKELKQKIRDVVHPGMDLGHVDKH